MNKIEKLKEYIKNVIRQELNEQPSFNLTKTTPPKNKINFFKPTLSSNLTGKRPTLKYTPNYDVKADIKSKPISLGLDAKSMFNKPKTYKDDWTGNLQRFGDEIQDTKTYKFLDTLANDKRIDIPFKKGKSGTLSLGKIGTYDPLDKYTRSDLSNRSQVGDDWATDQLKKAKKSDIMGVKYTVPIDKLNPFKKKR